MKFLKNKRGFSLIELMVVVAIMGILASIGIPQYLSYRRDAAMGALGSDLDNVVRAFNVCNSARGWDQCNTLDELNISNLNHGQDPATDAWGAKAPNFCVDIERTIGPVDYQSCVSVNAVSGMSTITSNIQSCYDDVAAAAQGTACTANANANSYDAPVTGCTGDMIYVAERCDADATGGQTGDAFCQSLTTARTGCATPAMGECVVGTGAGAGVCS